MPKNQIARSKPNRRTTVVRNRGLVTKFVFGDPLPGELSVPLEHRQAVTALFDKPNASGHDLARYLRYNRAVGEGWALGDAEAIADETYPWNQFGFSLDDEGTFEGPDCIAMDSDWVLITPRGEPTLDLRATRELWFDEDALDDERPRIRPVNMETLVTVTPRTGKSLFAVLSANREHLGWNLDAQAEARGRHLVVTHSTFSGKAMVAEGDDGVLLVRVVPTNKYDPERLLAVLLGALHRWFHDRAFSITVNYKGSDTSLSRSRKTARKSLKVRSRRV